MKVEVLYVAGCPSHAAAVELVKRVLAANGLSTDVHEILITDEQMAWEFEFLGSPTIRIDGNDIDDFHFGADGITNQTLPQKNFALSCRWYPDGNQIALPSAELIERAILSAQRETHPRRPTAKRSLLP